MRKGNVGGDEGERRLFLEEKPGKRILFFGVRRSEYSDRRAPFILIEIFKYPKLFVKKYPYANSLNLLFVQIKACPGTFLEAWDTPKSSIKSGHF